MADPRHIYSRTWFGVPFPPPGPSPTDKYFCSELDEEKGPACINK